MKKLARIIGNGVVAGLAGTAAMTISSTVEAKLRGRPFSKAPARAAQKVLGIKAFESPRDEARFSDLVHWGYGTQWGIVRAAFRELQRQCRLAARRRACNENDLRHALNPLRFGSCPDRMTCLTWQRLSRIRTTPP